MSDTTKLLRFAVQRQVDRLTGGKVEAQMPSGKPRHGARRYNRMALRGRVFMPGMATKRPAAAPGVKP